MARSRVELEISFEKFTVKYKGDIENGQNLGASVSQSLAGLAGLPNQLMASQNNNMNGGAVIPAAFIESSMSSEGEKSVPNKKVAKSTRSRSKGDAPQGLIDKLIDEGYFSQERSAADVALALSNKGHKFEADALSTPLTRLTKKERLTRAKKEKGPFMYVQAGLL